VAVADRKIEEGLLRALAAVLRPLVRQLVDQRVPSAVAEELVRRTYVEVAEAEFALPDRPQTDSRISVLTGVHRKDVRRLRHASEAGSPAPLSRDVAASLVSRWLADPRATDGAGRPIPIPFRAKQGVSFVELARATTRDLRPKPILDELVRSGAAECPARNRVVLRTTAYVPAGGQLEKLAMLAEDPAELLETMRRNVFETGEGRFQRKVSFDNVGADALPAVRRKLTRIGERTIDAIQKVLSPYDRDLHPEAPGGERCSVSMGVYLFDAPEEKLRGRRADRGRKPGRKRGRR
jgi:hypothetical protein